MIGPGLAADAAVDSALFKERNSMPTSQKDNHINDIERLEGLDMLDADSSEEAPKKRSPSVSDELPEVLYRLKTLHSSETLYGYFAPQGEWPHFRTMTELEAHLEGPFAAAGAPERANPRLEEAAPEGEGAAAAAEPAPAVTEPEADTEAYRHTEENKPEASMLIKARSLVIAPTKYGKDVVEVQGVVADTSFVNTDELVAIERPAGIDDLRKLKDNKEKEKRAYELCREKIWSRNLSMKLVSAHYLLDEPKILFYFTAESRVDFRELVKDLVSLFKMRIELRQIGVRDEARVTGGCGVCGRVLCCHGISDKLNPVSIKMAKDQNLSLNSLKISGPCGRLLCCLSYEFQFYKDARRELPQEGVKFIYDGTLFKVVEVNALSSMVKMAGEDGRVLDMKAERFKYSEGRWKVIEEAEGVTGEAGK